MELLRKDIARVTSARELATEVASPQAFHSRASDFHHLWRGLATLVASSRITQEVSPHDAFARLRLAGAISKRLRPSSFARYSAASAAATISLSPQLARS